MGEPGQPGDARGCRAAARRRARPGARRQSRDRSSPPRSKRPGATWSSATSTGVASRRGSIPRLRAAALKIAVARGREPGLPAERRGGWRRARRSVANRRERSNDSAELLRDARSNGALFLALPANGAGPQLDQRTGLAAADAVPEQRSDQLSRPDRRAGRVPHGQRHVAACRGSAADRRRAARDAAAVRRSSRCGCSPRRSSACSICCWRPRWSSLRRSARRAGTLSPMGAAAARRGRVKARVLVPARRRARGPRGPRRVSQALGWWTQWLLMSAFWWGAYLRRHQLFATAGAGIADAGASTEHARRRSLLRSVGSVLERPRTGIAVARWSRQRLSQQAPEGRDRKRARVGRERPGTAADAQAARTLEAEHRGASARAASAPETQQRLRAEQVRLQRLERERDSALAAGDRRRALELGHRAERVRGAVDREQHALGAAERVARAGQRAQRRTGVVYSSERRQQQSRLLDAQAALPSRRAPIPDGGATRLRRAGRAGGVRPRGVRTPQPAQPACRAPGDRPRAGAAPSVGRGRTRSARRTRDWRRRRRRRRRRSQRASTP